MPDLTVLSNWAQIISLFVAIAALLIAIYAAWPTKKKSTLTYMTDRVSTPIVMGTGETISSNLEIFYRTNRIEDLRIMQAKLINTSGKSIRKSHIVEPVTFSFAPGVELLDIPQILEAKPDNLQISWSFGLDDDQSPQLNIVVLEFELLNQDEEVLFEFVWTGDVTEPIAKARIEGITEIERISTTQQIISSSTGRMIRASLSIAGFAGFLTILLSFRVYYNVFDFLAFITGFILATFIGFVLGQIQKARRRVGAYYKPQFVMLQVAKPPQQVRADHFRAVFEITGWVFILIVGVSLFIYFLI